MEDSKDLVSKLEAQIAFLTSELERVRAKSESLWSSIYDTFIREGNDEEQAEFWSDKVAELVSSWVNAQRETLTKRIVSTGAMPPYTDCLNDLTVSICPPGSSPPAFTPGEIDFSSVPVSGPRLDLSPPPIMNGLSADAQPGPPRMTRVNVPKAIPGAVPLPLPPE